MDALQELLKRKWILRKENPDLYNKVRDSVKEIRKFVQEKFGYMIILTPYLIKLEKIPGYVEEWMGIQEFQSIQEYQMFCYILLFLESKEREEQFVLSSLTEYIQMQFEEGIIDWTHFNTRRQFVRVLKYCLSIHIIELNDGSEEGFIKDKNTEALYENTGYSRYVIRNFAHDIMDVHTMEDIEKSEWFSMEEDRGIVRRQRVYRRLLLSPGLYRKDKKDEDFVYIRHYYHQIEKDFQNIVPCNLHLHSSSGYIILDEGCDIGTVFPSRNTLSDLVLVCMQEITKKIKKGTLKINDEEIIIVEKERLLKWTQKWLKDNLAFLPKKYQDMGVVLVSENVLEIMKNFGFIDEEENNIKINPICGKIGGGFDVEVKKNVDK